MSSPPPPSDIPPDDTALTDEELRAVYEAELKRLRVDDLLLQTVVSLVNLGARRAGMVPGSEDETDLEQLGQAIEGTRALLPLVEPILGEEAVQLRDALSRLQMSYAQARGTGAGQPGQAAAPDEPDPAAEDPDGPGPAQTSGRLWVPGQ